MKSSRHVITTREGGGTCVAIDGRDYRLIHDREDQRAGLMNWPGLWDWRLFFFLNFIFCLIDWTARLAAAVRLLCQLADAGVVGVVGVGGVDGDELSLWADPCVVAAVTSLLPRSMDTAAQVSVWLCVTLRDLVALILITSRFFSPRIQGRKIYNCDL